MPCTPGLHNAGKAYICKESEHVLRDDLFTSPLRTLQFVQSRFYRKCARYWVQMQSQDTHQTALSRRTWASIHITPVRGVRQAGSTRAPRVPHSAERAEGGADGAQAHACLHNSEIKALHSTNSCHQVHRRFVCAPNIPCPSRLSCPASLDREQCVRITTVARPASTWGGR